MPAEPNPLLDFIGALKGQGANDEFVVNLLRQNGWSEKRIYQAFGAWYEMSTGKSVPNGGGRIEAAKDAFLYLLAFLTLGIWTIQLGALLFTAIDRAFPNRALDYVNVAWLNRGITNDLASVMVGFPLFLLVTRAIVNMVRHQPERLESSVRKWLTYLALVITASSMIADLVTFLAYFLRGDLSPRFVLKVSTVLVIAGGVFVYYFNSLRRETLEPSRNRVFAFGSLAVVVFGLVVGFRQIGSPETQRAAAEDARRLFDLSSLAQGLHSKWAGRTGTDFVLPANIRELQQTPLGGAANLYDPANGSLYEYIPSQGTIYRLCATFSHSSAADAPPQWRHGPGHVCFTHEAGEETQVVPR